MLPIYGRRASSGTGVGTELEPLSSDKTDVEMSIPPPPLPNNINNGNQVLSPYHCVRDLILSACFAVLGYYGTKHVLKPSEEYLRERDIPYQLLKNGEVILDLDLNYQLVDPPTVPSLLLVVTCVWIPLILMVIIGYASQRSWYISCKGVSSLLLGIGGSEGTTKVLKHWVLRRRPNFYRLCQFSLDTKDCEGDYAHVLEAQQSFPSGHSSLSWCAMVVLVWFLLSNGRNLGKLYKFVCIFFPISYATFVSCSRIVDYWHHPSDVLTGIFLGCLWGTIGFHVHDTVAVVVPKQIGALVNGSCHDCIKPNGLSSPTSKLPSFHE